MACDLRTFLSLTCSQPPYSSTVLTRDQILSSTFGLSFWPVPTTAAMESKLAVKFGEATSAYWMSMFSQSNQTQPNPTRFLKLALTNH